MKKLIEYLNQLPDRQRVLLSLLAILLIGWMDYWSMPELFTALFYFIPITIAAGYPDIRFSYLVSLLSAMAWLISDYASGQVYSSQLMLTWNVMMRLVLFLFVARILFTLRQNAGHFEHLANIDPLTGALNRRGFISRTNEELNRARRFNREFSIAFIDLDNFKVVNDQYGHQAGDRLLEVVVATMKQNLRIIDLIGRFGGDEFAILFIEATQTQAREAFDKCYTALNLAMKNHCSGIVTFSCSVMTYQKFDFTLDEMLDQADKWLYWVKANGKGQVVYRYSEQTVDSKNTLRSV